MPPTPPWMILTLTSSVDSLRSACASASSEPCTSALTISARVLTSPSRHLLEHVLELGGLLLGELDVAELALAEQRDFARLALVGQHHDVFAG